MTDKKTLPSLSSEKSENCKSTTIENRTALDLVVYAEVVLPDRAHFGFGAYPLSKEGLLPCLLYQASQSEVDIMPPI